MYDSKYSTTDIVKQCHEQGLKVIHIEKTPNDSIRGYLPITYTSDAPKVARRLARALPGALVDGTPTPWLGMLTLGFTLPAVAPESIGLATPLALLALPAPSPAAVRAWKAQQDAQEKARFMLDLGKRLASLSGYVAVHAIGRDGQYILDSGGHAALVIRSSGSQLVMSDYVPDRVFYRGDSRRPAETYTCTFTRDDLTSLLKAHADDHNRLAGCTAPAPRSIPRPAPLPVAAATGR